MLLSAITGLVVGVSLLLLRVDLALVFGLLVHFRRTFVQGFTSKYQNVDFRRTFVQ